MKILTHTVKNYRNIAELSLNFGDGTTVICGRNGQGKTNLLESIWLLTGARSFRQSADTALVKDGCEFAVISSDFFSRERKQNLRLTISEQGRKMSLNRGAAQSASSLAGSFFCVVFSPDHLELIKGSAEKRRRFIDAALCQLYPGYLAALKKYTRLLQQKNSLLKDSWTVAAALDMLDVIDFQLAQCAVFITEKRREFSLQLSQFANGYQSDITAGSERLTLEYVSTLFSDRPAEIEAAVGAMAASRGTDIKLGFCSQGVHRDDLAVKINGRDTRSRASQGQQRSCVLALKLAEADIFSKVTEQRPVLLLDDVFSELDFQRREFLIECIGGTQAIMTGCELSPQEEKNASGVYFIDAGGLSQYMSDRKDAP